MINTRFIPSLSKILDDFDVAVLDQWGVLHDGSTPYPHARDAMEMLTRNGKQIVIVSNSGKRAELNRERIGRIGLPTEMISTVITSGEALWQDLVDQRLTLDGKTPRRLFVICGNESDPEIWAAGSDRIEIVNRVSEADAVLLMGVPERISREKFDDVLNHANDLGIPLICSNPDKASPRPDGLVMSPGVLADRYAQIGGTVVWYGKPHATIYRAVLRSFPGLAADRFLMVGDSLEHDVAGAQRVGFRSAFVRGGIHASDFEQAKDQQAVAATLTKLTTESGVAPPDFFLDLLR